MILNKRFGLAAVLGVLALAVTAGAVGALALVSAPTATAAGTIPVKTTISGKGCDPNGINECIAGGGGSCLCLDEVWNFSGTGLLGPPIGRAPFHLRYENEHICVVSDDGLSCDYVIYSRGLTLSFRATNGELLVLSESFFSTTPFAFGSGSWTVDRQHSTGRFARYSGTGTYTLTIDPHYDYATVVVRLAGSLTTS